MTRRVVIGSSPGQPFRIRVSKPGYDALTAPLEGMLFDADHYPGKILGSGQSWVNYNTRTQGRNSPVDVVRIGHGLGRAPDIVAATAQPQFNSPSSGPGPWQLLSYVPEVNTVSFIPGALGNPNMDGRFCTPWRCEGNNKGGQFNSGSGGYYFGGWWYGFDASDIIIYQWCCHPILVRWTALEVF